MQTGISKKNNFIFLSETLSAYSIIDLDHKC